jgi:hypothetical protein
MCAGSVNDRLPEAVLARQPRSEAIERAPRLRLLLTGPIPARSCCQARRGEQRCRDHLKPGLSPLAFVRQTPRRGRVEAVSPPEGWRHHPAAIGA